LEKKLADKEEQLTFRVNDELPPEEKEKERILIHQIACSIKDGEADPKDAKHMMELFCNYVNKEIQGRKQVYGCPPDKQIPNGLLLLFRDAFKAILKGKTPEQALGIKRRKGGARKTELHIDTAMEYLKLAIKDIKPTEIKEQLDFKFNLGKSQLEGIWKKYKVEALWQLRDEREKSNPFRFENPFRPKEITILKKLYPWTPEDEKRLKENRNPTRYRQNPTRSPSHH